MTDEWRFPTPVGYFDSRTSAVPRLSQRLAESAERDQAIATIGDHVCSYLRASTDDVVTQLAFVVIDDLYAAACSTPTWDDDLATYLLASAGPMFQTVIERGFVVHYVVDNEYSSLERPLDLFPSWFRCCGFVYICPQELGRRLMTADGVPLADQPERTSYYAEEATGLAGRLIGECVAQGRHFVYLDADATDVSIEQALAVRNQPGVISIFRNAVPGLGSTCNVTMPSEHRSADRPNSTP